MSHKPNKLEGQITAIGGKKIYFATEQNLENIVEIFFIGENPFRVGDVIRVSREKTMKQGTKIDSSMSVDASVYLQVKTNNIVSYNHIGTVSIKYGDINGKR